MRIFFIVSFLSLLYACDNDLTTIGDNLIPNEHYVEVKRFILDETSTIKLDSFPTSDMSTSTSSAKYQFLIGKMIDDITGTVTPIPYFQVAATGFASNVNWATNCTYDSLTLTFPYSKTLAGDTIERQTYDLYQIEQNGYPRYNIDNPIFTNLDSLQWRSNNPISTLTIFPQKEYLTEDYLKRTYFKLSDDIGKDLFDKMRSRDPMFENYLEFMKYFGGLAIVPRGENNLLMSLNPSDLELRCHYHIGAQENLYFKLPILSSNSGNIMYAFNNIKYTPTPEFDKENISFTKELPFEKNKQAIIESLSGFMVKLKIPFISDNVKYKTLVKAEIEFKPKTNTWENIPEPRYLSVFVIDENNYVKQVLSDYSQNTIYGILSQNTISVESKKYTIDITDFYAQKVEGVSPLDKDIYLLIGVPGYIYSPWSGYQIFTGDVSSTFQRVVIEELPILNLYYSHYK